MAAHTALVLAMVVAQLGGSSQATPRIGPSTPSGGTLDRLERSVTRPTPVVPAPPMGRHSADVWVPDRIVPVPGQPGGAMVPGHWERRLSDNQNYVPPLTATTPDGRVIVVPGGVLPPPNQRQSP
jgi:hypothetical protein